MKTEMEDTMANGRLPASGRAEIKCGLHFPDLYKWSITALHDHFAF